MSRANVEIVRRLYRAMNARDLAAATELMHRGAEWIPDSRVGEKPVRGRENLLRFFTDRAEMFNAFCHEPERLRDRGETVLVFVHLTGRGQASGSRVRDSDRPPLDVA